MLSWEYPPKSVGGLSNHVYNLAQSLSNMNHEVHVITCRENSSIVEEQDGKVFVYRVLPYNIHTEDFSKWVMHLNFSMIEEAIRLINKIGKFDIIHAHDWLSAYSAKAIKGAFNIPMVCTIHATEYGRNSGIRTEMQKYISSAEWMLTYEAWKVIACSNYMKNEIKEIFNVPEEKIWIIPNGVNPEIFNIEFDHHEFRRNYAYDEEKIIFYVGRHVYEKGIHLLVEAAPEILRNYSNAKFVIAGKGNMTEELKNRVRALNIDHKFLFTGYMDDETRNKLYKVSDAAVFPSLYEPFGIVALEAMAAECPVVVSDTGGLGEIVTHKLNGMKIIPGAIDSLKDNIVEILKNEELSRLVKENGTKDVYEKYTWDKVAEQTNKMYEMVKEEALRTEWGNCNNYACITTEFDGLAISDIYR